MIKMYISKCYSLYFILIFSSLVPLSSAVAIVNGTLVKEDGSGFVRWTSPSGTTCSGTLITNKWVLSAAHCIGWDDQPSQLRFTMGTQSAGADWISRYPKTDIVLVRLDQPFQMQGSSADYRKEIFMGPMSDLETKSLDCYGYGGSFDLRKASLQMQALPDNVDPERKDLYAGYVIKPNETGQMIEPGDSGGSCVYTLDNGQNVLTGVQNGFWGNAFNQTSATLFRDWVHHHIHADNRGSALATGDFDGDGYEDIAIGYPGGEIGGNKSGLVEIYRGWSGGFYPPRTISQQHIGANETGDRFGAALAVGDFNGDGLQDLAIGAPNEALGETPLVGYVFVFKGSPKGLEPWHGLSQSGLGVDEEGDMFGHSLVTGDFNGDGKDDLAIGAPNEKPDQEPRSGYVFIFQGSNSGLKTWHGFSETSLKSKTDGDLFGYALATGDFDADGRDDLAVGAPGKTVGQDQRFGSGYVFVFKGQDSGLLPWKGIGEFEQGCEQVGDMFGWSLATGDFNVDGQDDLAVGAPGAGIPVMCKRGTSSGRVFVYAGNSNGPTPWHAITQDTVTTSVGGFISFNGLDADESGDWFGASLAVGKFGSQVDHLVVGAPGQNVLGEPDAGLVLAFKGGSIGGLEPWLKFSQSPLKDINEKLDGFGSTIANFRRGPDDLVVGAPGETLPWTTEPGGVFLTELLNSTGEMLFSVSKLLELPVSTISGRSSLTRIYASSLNTSGNHQTKFGLLEPIDVQAELHINVANQGIMANIFVVALYNGNWYMKDSTQTWLFWDGNVNSLLANSTQKLGAVIPVAVFEKLSGLPGNFSVFIGHGSADGDIHYNSSPLNFTVK